MSAKDPEYLYALKCIFNAHAGDVRVLKPTCIPDGGILTGSRDTTTKVWTPEGKSFRECNTFKGATTFISSLCVLPPSTQYPKGLFLAGSNDCSIYGFTPDSTEPVLRLLGHSGTVCTLSYGKGGFLVSGSWDKTARVWSGQQCVLTLQGHLEAVWATDVFATQNLILTGSADHTIRLWRAGVTEKIFTGHQDCVRGLAIVSDTKFLSCSNDNTVRMWSTSGECLETFKSHTDYIYSISLLSNGTDFVTCGEDQNVKIWRGGVCNQTFVLASKSLWCVSCLSNGDLAVGTSDGKVYVLEKVPSDYFNGFSDQSQNEKFHSMNNGVDLTRAEGDNGSSIYSGEKVVMYQNHNNSMYVYQYDYAVGTKVKKQTLDFQFIEDTFYKKHGQGNGNSEVSLKKKDYVFDVDVENTIYKLAFNKGENPWDVATKFVAEHNFPTDHIGQIVDYILKNTTTSFTNDIYPAKNYLSYLNVNIDGLRAKLLQFCEQVPKEKYISPSEVDELMLLAHFPDVVSVEQMSSLDKAVSWSDDLLFPVLDLLRLGVKCKGLRSKISSKEFVNHLLHIFLHSKKSVNRVLIEKIFCNMFGMDETEDVLTHFQDKIFEAVKEKISIGEDSIQKAGSALFLNFAIASYNGFEINTDRYCLNIVDILSFISDSDAIYRVLVAIGTVCTRNSLAVSYFRSVNMKEIIFKFASYSENPKLKKVIELLCSDF